MKIAQKPFVAKRGGTGIHVLFVARPLLFHALCMRAFTEAEVATVHVVELERAPYHADCWIKRMMILSSGKYSIFPVSGVTDVICYPSYAY